MLKKDVTAKLSELKIEFDAKAKLADLLPLLPEDVRAEMEKADAEAAAKDDVKSEGTVADVFAATGGLIRTYTVADHGDKFEELAKEFVAHTPGSRIVVK